jgi:hypothetical protein
MLASPHTDHNAFCAKCLFVGGMLLISARLVNSQRGYASLDLQGLFNLWVSFFLYLWSQSPLVVPTPRRPATTTSPRKALQSSVVPSLASPRQQARHPLISGNLPSPCDWIMRCSQCFGAEAFLSCLLRFAGLTHVDLILVEQDPDLCHRRRHGLIGPVTAAERFCSAPGPVHPTRCDLRHHRRGLAPASEVL